MAPNRFYSSSGLPTVLSAAIVSTSATTFTIPVSPASLNWPSSFPYTLLLDWGTGVGEAVKVTAVSGTGPYTLTVVRGQDGTTAATHAVTLYANVFHGVSAQDFAEPQAHMAAASSVHGVTGSVVGTTDTQTLVGKTLTSVQFTGGGNNGTSDHCNVKDPIFGAVGDGITDDTAAIQAAIDHVTGASSPSTTTRTPIAALYLPGGTYKITSDLIIRSVSGFRIVTDGPGITVLRASGTAFTTAVLLVDGSYKSVYGGLTIVGDGTEQVTDAIRLDWTTAASRSTTSNRFHDIDIRNLNFVVGLSLEGNSTRQVDGTLMDNVLISGGQNHTNWSNTGNWQKGVAFGDGSFANNYDHLALGVSVSGCYYGYYDNISSFMLHGAQPANNFIDFWITPGGQTTVTNVQSQNSGQFLTAPSNFSPLPNSFNDCQFKTNFLQGSGNAVMTITGGLWNFNNFSATNLIIGASYVNGTIAIAGAAVSRPAICNFSNLALFNTRTSCFTGLTNSPIITVQGYANYSPTTGLYTYAPGDVSSFYVHGSWTAAELLLSSTAPNSVNAASNQAVTQGLAPIWYGHLGDINSGVCPDSSGNGNAATVTGTITTATGPPGMTAGVFAASGDFAVTSTFTATAPAKFSVEIWFKTAALANNVAMLSGGSFAQTTHTGFNLILFTDNNVYWDWGDGTVRNRINSSGGPVTANVWHHAVGIYTGAESVLYLDGVKVASGAFTGPMSWASPQIALAQAYTGIGGTPHSISMADAGVFPVALTASQVAARYQAGINGQVLNPALGNALTGTSTSAGIFDVTAFGATGDGITDDGTAIQNTINAAQANGGGTILFPYGKYYYTVTPQITGANLKLESTSTAPLYGSTGGACLMPKDFTIDGLDITSTASQIQLRNLRFVPKSATGGSGGSTGTCMVSIGGTLVDMRNVLMPKAYNGVHITGGNVTISQCTVNPLSVAQGSAAGNYCFWADGSGSGTGAFFDNCSAWTAETTPPGVTSSDADGYVFSDGYGSPVMRDCQALGTYRSIWCFNRTARTDSSGVTVTNGSAVVLDTSAVATDLNRGVSGTGVQALSTIISVVPGVSFTMSLPANAGGTSVTLAATPGPGGLVVKGFTFDHTGTGIQLDALGFSGFFTDIIGTSSYNNPGGINVGAGVAAASLQFDNIILAAGPTPLVISPTAAVAVNISNAVFTNIGSSTAAIECTGASAVVASCLTVQLGGGSTSAVQLDAGFTGNFTATGINFKGGTNGLKTIAGGTGVFVIVGGVSQHDNSLGVTPSGSKVQFVSGMTSV